MGRGKLYRNGFFAFLTGAVLIGVLLGTLSCCLLDKTFLSSLQSAGGNFLDDRKSENFGQILVSSLGTCTLFLGVIFLCGFSPVGQLFEVAALVFRGMGLGVTLSQLYLSGGRSMIAYSCLMVVPAAVITSVAMMIGAREAVLLSNIYLRTTFADRQVDGLLETVKLYAAKFLVLEAVIAVGSGVDCLCTILMVAK